MAWCKASSLTAAVMLSLRRARYPAARATLHAAADGKPVEGWDIAYFLGQALKRSRYPDLRTVVLDLEGWLEKQG